MATRARPRQLPDTLDDRATDILCARAYLAESHRRGKQPFAFWLLQAAGNARRRAASKGQPLQLSLLPDTATNANTDGFSHMEQAA